MSERKWFDVTVFSLSVWAECEDEVQEILDSIDARFPKRPTQDKPTIELVVTDIEEGEE